MAGRSTFGHIRQRPNGRWQARWQDAAGRQHSATFATKGEAAKWLRDQSKDVDGGTWVDPVAGRETFGAFADRWRQTIVDLRESTLTRDLEYLDRYMMPTFGGRQLAAIDALAVRQWIAGLNAGHAPATTVKAAQIFGKIMREAVDLKLIASSPAAGAKLPKIEDADMRFLTADEIWTLADAVDERYRGLILLGAFGGLRVGEMLGLRTSRVDALRRTVNVAEIVTEVGGRNLVGPPKTRAGRRAVQVPAFVIDALDLSRRDGLVFVAPKGGHVHLSSWRQRYWRPAVRAAGLEPLRIHDLRHTAVSLWIAAGASALEVARRAGHSRVAVVFDRYGHLLPGSDDRLTDALEAFGPPVRAAGAVVRSLDAVRLR